MTITEGDIKYKSQVEEIQRLMSVVGENLVEVVPTHDELSLAIIAVHNAEEINHRILYRDTSEEGLR